MKAGDHIRILKNGVWFHAIDVGDRTVISFSTAGGLRRAQLSELAGGAQKVEVVTHTERVYPPKAVVARAFSRFSISAYSAMFADSEAFATWCKSGQQRATARDGAAVGPLVETAPVVSPAMEQEAAPERAEPARGSGRAAKLAAAGAAKSRPAKASAKPRAVARASASPKPKRGAKAAPRARAARAKTAAAKGSPARKAAAAGRGSAKRGARPAKGGAGRGAAAAKKAAPKRGAAKRSAARRRA